MKHSGFTLLEIMLTLALIVVVLGLLGMAVDVHLRVVDASRNEVEETQLARLVLQRMADDLRSAIPFVQSSSSGGASSSGSSQDATQQTFLLGGISGNSRELLVNISRLPLLPPSGAMASDGVMLYPIGLPSDVRTITYRVVKPGEAGLSDATGARDQRCGLVRGEWERAAYAWAIQQGQTDEISRAQKVLAPEVEIIEFTYLDGSTTYQEWDSLQQGKLPTAVRIAIAIRRPRWKAQRPSATGTTEESPSTVYETLVYLPNAHATLSQAIAAVSKQSTAASQEVQPSDSNFGGSSP